MRHEREPGPACEVDVLAPGPIPGVLERARGPHEAPAEQESDARLQVGEVRHRHQQFAARGEHAMELGECARLIRVREVFEHVEAEDAFVRAIGRRQREQRGAPDEGRLVVVVHAVDAQARRVFLDEHSLAAARVEHPGRRRESIEIRAHDLELREVGGVVVPARVGPAMVVAPLGVFAAADLGRTGGGHSGFVHDAPAGPRTTAGDHHIPQAADGSRSRRRMRVTWMATAAALAAPAPVPAAGW